MTSTMKDRNITSLWYNGNNNNGDYNEAANTTKTITTLSLKSRSIYIQKLSLDCGPYWGRGPGECMTGKQDSNPQGGQELSLIKCGIGYEAGESRTVTGNDTGTEQWCG